MRLSVYVKRRGEFVTSIISCAWIGILPVSTVAQTTHPASESYWKKDPVALRQEIDSFTSLQDGQPAAPGDWELQLDGGWNTRSHRHDHTLIEPVVKYTPHRYTSSGYEFFEAMQLSLRMPLDVGRGEVVGNGDMTFGWQERWLVEHDGLPTVATLAEIRMPTGRKSNGADGTLTGILDKDFGPGTMYLNGWVRTANGESENGGEGRTAKYCVDFYSSGASQSLCENGCDRRHFQWGVRLGYKWRVCGRTSLIVDYVHQSSEKTGRDNVNLLELAAEFRTQHRVAFGPGVFVGLDRNAETPRLGAGFRILYLFNARTPPAE